MRILLITLHMFEDSGWKHIVGNKSSISQYFKKGRTNNEDDIFSDSNSKAGKYKRLINITIISIVWLLMLTSALYKTWLY